MLVVVTYKKLYKKLRPVWQVIDKKTCKVLSDFHETVQSARRELKRLEKVRDGN